MTSVDLTLSHAGLFCPRSDGINSHGVQATASNRNIALIPWWIPSLTKYYQKITVIFNQCPQSPCDSALYVVSHVNHAGAEWEWRAGCSCISGPKNGFYHPNTLLIGS